MKLIARGVLTVIAACPTCDARVTSRDQACGACGAALAGVDFGRDGKIDPVLADQEIAAARDPSKLYTAERWVAYRARRDGIALAPGEVLGAAARAPAVASSTPPTPTRRAAQLLAAEHLGALAAGAAGELGAELEHLADQVRAGDVAQTVSAETAAARLAPPTPTTRAAQLLAAEHLGALAAGAAGELGAELEHLADQVRAGEGLQTVSAETAPP